MKDRVSILDGSTFVVSDGNGDIEPATDFPMGLFSYDTRFLSRWKLTINGESLNALSVDDLQYFETRFFLVPGRVTQYVDAKLSVIRHRTVGGSFDECLTVLNHDVTEATVTLRLDISCDFADFFEIKDEKPKAVAPIVLVSNDQLHFVYRRETFQRDLIVSSSAPATFDQTGLTFTVSVPSHGRWSTTVHAETKIRGVSDRDLRQLQGTHQERTRAQLSQELSEWLAKAPKLSTDYAPLSDAYRRSLTDLAALQMRTPWVSLKQPTAGLPWFMAFFGRDSLITAYQVLPFYPELAAASIVALAQGQGTVLHDLREEEPGKIFHESRLGESAAFEEQPHSPYYGSADATPLWLIVLDEYERWTGDTELVGRYEPEARAAIAWIDTYADLVGNGYIWYLRRNTETGLENQCWKDSWDSISYHDGRLPDPLRAVCEHQGYAYDAKRRAARLARTIWHDPAFADQLEHSAAQLKERFNRDFWVGEREFYALGLDRDGNPIDSLASNMGHLLWSGIADRDHASKVAEHLMGPRLFSGWGVRTLAADEGRYNPVGYHIGTVWPFDNSLVAAGLRRYGFDEEAARITQAVLEASTYFHGRLPEAFAGYDRAETRYPVQYPTACSPQAWSSGTPLLFLRIMLGMEPHTDHLAFRPKLPETINRIELLDVRVPWGYQDAIARRRTEEA